jgi:peptidoglycan hydrolase CwlO-like protein
VIENLPVKIKNTVSGYFRSLISFDILQQKIDKTQTRKQHFEREIQVLDEEIKDLLRRKLQKITKKREDLMDEMDEMDLEIDMLMRQIYRN